MIDPFAALPRAHYRCISADPPWAFKTYSEKDSRKSPSAHYHVMDLEAIKALPVACLAHPGGCVLTMWCTAPMIPQALEVLACWGFKYKSFGAWAKLSSTGEKWAFGTGYVYRSASEFWITGTRGKISPMSRGVRNLIVAPVREHSRKPDRMAQDLECLWPGPRLELFARERRPGWDAFGLEIDKF